MNLPKQAICFPERPPRLVFARSRRARSCRRRLTTVAFGKTLPVSGVDHRSADRRAISAPREATPGKEVRTGEYEGKSKFSCGEIPRLRSEMTKKVIPSISGHGFSRQLENRF